MTRKEWEYMGFGFGAAVVLGVATWGAVELGKKCLAKAKENGWLQTCCCCGEEAEDPCCGEEAKNPDEEVDEDFVDKSVNAQDDVVAPEFDRNIDFPE